MPNITVKIVSRFDSAEVLFECEVPDTIASGLRTRYALEKATEARADLAGADLADADLAGADLAGANLADAYLAGADLAGADLAGADLAGAYLAGAYLAGAYLAGAYLAGADLAGANLAGADLADADLADADLAGAYLAGAYLDVPRVTDEQAIANLDKVREIVLDDTGRLDMGLWHGGGQWRERTCAEETLCGTAHCLAGWLQVCSTDPKVRDLAPSVAGMVMAPIASKMFYRGGAETLDWLRERKYVADIAEHHKRVAQRKAKREAQGEQS